MKDSEECEENGVNRINYLSRVNLDKLIFQFPTPRSVLRTENKEGEEKEEGEESEDNHPYLTQSQNQRTMFDKLIENEQTSIHLSTLNECNGLLQNNKGNDKTIWDEINDSPTTFHITDLMKQELRFHFGDCVNMIEPKYLFKKPKTPINKISSIRINDEDDEPKSEEDYEPINDEDDESKKTIIKINDDADEPKTPINKISSIKINEEDYKPINDEDDEPKTPIREKGEHNSMFGSTFSLSSLSFLKNLAIKNTELNDEDDEPKTPINQKQDENGEPKWEEDYEPINNEDDEQKTPTNQIKDEDDEPKTPINRIRSIRTCEDQFYNKTFLGESKTKKINLEVKTESFEFSDTRAVLTYRTTLPILPKKIQNYELISEDSDDDVFDDEPATPTNKIVIEKFELNPKPSNSSSQEILDTKSDLSDQKDLKDEKFEINPNPRTCFAKQSHELLNTKSDLSESKYVNIISPNISYIVTPDKENTSSKCDPLNAKNKSAFSRPAESKHLTSAIKTIGKDFYKSST